MGRVERGFDFLGYFIEPVELGISAKSAERFQERIARLYEQGADGVRVGQYVRKWRQWAKSGGRIFVPVNWPQPQTSMAET